MRKGVLAVITLAAWWFLISAAAAKDLYVNNVAGDDHWDGRAVEAGSPGNGPVRTISQALWVADAGDHINIANTGEAYRESLSLRGAQHSGYPQSLFIIEGNGATLDGSAPVPPDSWRVYRGDIVRFQPERVAYQQLFLNGKPAARRMPTINGEPPALKPLEWALAGGWIYFCVESGKLPQQYPLTYAKRQTGVTLYQTQNIHINNLVVQGYQLDGINVQDVLGGCEIAGVTARGNGRSGIAICGASRVVIDACLAGSNGESQVHLEGPSETTIARCDLIPGAGPKWLQLGLSRLYVGTDR